MWPAYLRREAAHRVRPEDFLKKIRWLTGHAAKKLHDGINIGTVDRLLDSPYTFVSVDTLRNPENPLPHVFGKIAQNQLGFRW